jgi:quercetin dioxygenase-like cupin family protein
MNERASHKGKMITMRRVTTMFGRSGAALLFAAVLTATAVAQTPAHVVENLSAAKWGPAPPLLPPGAQIAVLAGDPTKAGPYTVRLKFPANYDIPAHSHPTDENVLVVSGELFAGMGMKLDRKAGLGLGPGGVALMPANARHFAYTKRETTILLYGQGPVEFTYVNPADDPRAKTSTSHK